MEASAVPRAAPAGVSGSTTLRLLGLVSDVQLVTLLRQGHTAAFDALYDRHHAPILSFCRHLLGDPQEAEDAVQQTFLAAYHDLITSDKPIHLRAWLFTIARNRCFSIIRARREHPSADLGETLTEGLAMQVQQRQDLRDLIADIQRLPHDQRAALVLAELDALSHEQIGEVLGVPKGKVKALVFQAREALAASRDARDADCGDIREQLLTLHGGGLRRGHIRRHLRQCPSCRAYRKQVERQRRSLALLLPAAPTLALRDTVLATVAGGATGGELVAGTVVKGGFLKSLVGVVAAGLGTAGALVAAHSLGGPIPTPILPVTGHLTTRAPLVAAVSSSGGALTKVAAVDARSGRGAHVRWRKPRPFATRALTSRRSAGLTRVGGRGARRVWRSAPGRLPRHWSTGGLPAIYAAGDHGHAGTGGGHDGGHAWSRGGRWSGRAWGRGGRWGGHRGLHLGWRHRRR